MNEVWKIREELYKDYLASLTEESGIYFGPDVKTEAMDFYKKSLYNEWIDLSSDGEIIGFLITGWGEDCHPDCDYFIAQAYVNEKHRKKGIMSEAVKKYIESHPGKYCLLILKGNVHAQDYWDELFKEEGYTQVPLKLLPGMKLDNEIPVCYEKDK